MLIWKTQTMNVNVASMRYRCLLPLRYLRKLGLESTIFGGKEPVQLSARTQAIVFVKSFQQQDVMTCERAYQLGVPIILDLCDNIFIEEYAADSSYVPADNFQVMAKRAAAIVTTGEALKCEVERRLLALGIKVPTVIIPDGSETLNDIDYAFQLMQCQRLTRPLRQRVRSKLLQLTKTTRQAYGKGKKSIKRRVKWAKTFLAWLQQTAVQKQNEGTLLTALPVELLKKLLNKAKPKPLAIPPCQSNLVNTQTCKTTAQPIPVIPGPWPKAAAEIKSVLWFGNHGAKYGNFGMLNILDVADALVSLNEEQPLRLVVVSNSREKYEQHIAPLPFETIYLRWHPRRIYDYIRASDVVIIPNSRSAFSICKSANRAVLALSQGTPVVASHTPALEVLSSCICVDDWEAGLRQYLLQPEIGCAHVAKAQQLIEDNFSGDVIAQQWLALFKQVIPTVQLSPERISNHAVVIAGASAKTEKVTHD